MATERFLDANVLIRHLSGDNPEQSPAATALLRRIELGEEFAWTTHLVIAEAVWVLSGPTYGATRRDLVEKLTTFIESSRVRIDDANALLEGLRIWANTPLSFIDSVHAALVRLTLPPELYSWDRGFDRIPGITRFEPPAPAAS